MVMVKMTHPPRRKHQFKYGRNIEKRSLNRQTIEALTGKPFSGDYLFAEVWGTTVKVKVSRNEVHYIKIVI